MQIFISYRRRDSRSISRLLAEKLRTRYGQNTVFQDVTEIAPGADFSESIRREIERSDILLALIGPNWVREGGADRVDWVFREIESALENRLEILPVLVEGGTMPPEESLPATIRFVTRLNAIKVDPGNDFEAHVNRLCDAISAGETTRARLGDAQRIAGEARRAAYVLDRAGWRFSPETRGDQYVFLLTLKRFLQSTGHLFAIQLDLAKELVRGLETGRRGLDDGILAVADQIPVERYWLRRRLRNETDTMREVHGALLRLLSENRDLFELVPNLDQLYDHLSMWVAKYECLRNEDGMCLIFVGPEQRMAFPKQVETDICKAVDQLDEELRFR
ncbi:MAG: toll/interleukin-1 receptor domain-containing protein [Pseudomonadota bacterium]